MTKLLGALAVIISAFTSPSSAQSVLEIAAGVKFCKTLTDDAQRLKCFDGLFAEKPKSAAVPKQSAELKSWSIEDSKSPIDDSPQVTGILAGQNDSVLALRCKEHSTDVLFSKRFTYLGSSPIKVLVRIDDGKPIETV